MTANIPQTDAERLERMRALAAALRREAGRLGAPEVVDLAAEIDDLATDLLRQRTN